MNLLDFVIGDEEHLRNRIAKHVRREGACLIWTGATNGRRKENQRPWVVITFSDGRQKIYVSRIVLSIKLGRPMRDDRDALHTCDNSLCVAEEHLYEGTALDNARDRVERNPQIGIGRRKDGRYPAAKHSVEQAQLCKEMMAEGRKPREILAATSFNSHEQYGIRSGKIWSWV